MEATIKTEDGQTKTVVLTEDAQALIEELSKERLTDGMLADRIRNLDIPADVKLILTKIGSQAIKIGDVVYNIGKKILEIVFMITNEYPNTLFGLIVGLIFSSLVNGIPILGWIFGPFIGPLTVGFGLAAGYMTDLRDKRIQQAVRETVNIFSVLKEQGRESD